MKIQSRQCCFFRTLFLMAAAGIFLHGNPASATPALPVINTNNIVNVTNFGAIGDGVTTNTLAISNAIVRAAAGGMTNGAAGGTVEIPAGIYLSGPLVLKSAVNLQIDAGATLQMLPMSSWPNANTPFILGSSIHDVEISGLGTIDGQGAAWWSAFNSKGVSRPNFIQFSSSSRILIQGVTLQNPPTFHIMIKNNNVNITVQNITINTPGNSPNTDGFDIASTNVLIQNSYVSDGDDNIEIGGSQLAAYITVTNCTFGTGHGVSFGSITSGGVSNIVVINCSFTGTDYGIRLKSDNSSSGGGAGGLCQNFLFQNLAMTNITKAPYVIYSYYEETGTPTSITPQTAATEPVATVVPTTVIWRNITNINLTINSPGTIAGIIWGRTEMPVTNVIFRNLNIAAAKSFDIYNAAQVQFVDSKITLSAANNSTFTLFNAQVVITNTAPTNTLFTFDGLTTNSYGNTLTFYNAQASLKNTNALDDGPLTLNASTFTVSNNLTLFPSTVLNYALGTNAATIAVTGDLNLGGAINVINGAGFTNGSYTLLTYNGNLGGILPVLGAVPSGYNFSFDTNTAGQVNLIASLPAPAAPANLIATPTNLVINLEWNSVAGAISYNLKRGTTNGGPYPTIFSGSIATNYADVNVTNGVTYYYVVTTVSGSESANSLQASAAPLPSSSPANILFQTVADQLQLSWPQDHLGWHLQIQTNDLSGIGTNWTDVPDSNMTNQVFIPIDANNGSVFLRLAYP